MPFKHLVVFEFKPDTTAAQIDGVMQSLRALVGKIPGLVDFVGGAYSGPYPGASDLNKRYTHGFVMTFRDAATRAGYLPHPEHIRAKDALMPLLADVMAFDFEC